MADLLSTGVSALIAYRRALDTAGHNIANVNTPGYTRQRVELTSRLGGPSGDGYIGAGVDASTTRRITDGFIGQRIVADTSAFTRSEALEGIASTLDTWLSDPSTGLTQALGGFFEGLNTLAANPASSASRQSALAGADALATRLRSLQTNLDSLQSEVNARVRQDVDQINQAAQAIAGLNERIAQARGAAGGQPPNDLLDQRDQLIQELAGKVGISTVEADDGAINVFTGSGQALVLGQQAGLLGVSDDAYGAGSVEITFNGAPITDQIGGGSLGGLLDARREVLDPAQSRLGRLAAGLVESVNAQHAQGVDATGQAGGEFFSPISGTALPARTNAGGAQIEVGFADVSSLTGEDYELSFDGASWSLRNASSGASVALGGSGTAGDPFTAEGLSLTVSGSASAGDRFLIRPTADAAGQVRLAITDPARIAAAAAGSGANSSDNGNARALAQLSNQGLFDGGRGTLLTAHSELVSRVGNQAQQAGVARSAQENLLAQSQASRDAVSGVSLDEEASDLVRFQQAYQAAAQVIAVADTVFQSLLEAARR